MSLCQADATTRALRIPHVPSDVGGEKLLKPAAEQSSRGRKNAHQPSEIAEKCLPSFSVPRGNVGTWSLMVTLRDTGSVTPTPQRWDVVPG